MRLELLFTILAAAVLAAGLSLGGGCNSSGRTTIESEYAYLAPLVRAEIRWTAADYYAFLNACKPKHLVEVAHGCGVTGFDGGPINDPNEQIRQYGGKDKLIADIQCDILWDSSWAFTYKFKGFDVPYGDLVEWAAAKKDASVTYGGSTFANEKAIITKLFTDAWDRLTPAQRQDVVAHSDLNTLTTEQKASIVAGSGAAALGVLSTAAVIGGIGFYTTMSSAMCATAAVFGVTLPFAAYTGASTTIGVLTGPIGWTAIGICAVAGAAWATAPNSSATCKDIVAIHLLKVKALESADQLK